MKTLSLNYCRIGNPETVSELHTLVGKEDLSIVFLMETRLELRHLEFLRVRLGMRGCFGVDRHGFGGGLALLWSSSIDIHIQSFSNHHIDADVIQEDGLRWRATGFYGHPERAMRVHSWSLLRHLYRLRSMPWLVMGDFNEIISLDEKWGREDRSLAIMAAFREAMLDCYLQDLGFRGPEFTWSNRRVNGDLVRVRLDRCIANEEWLSLFPRVQVSHVIVSSSNHMGALANLDPPIGPPMGRRRRRFRFGHIWVRESGCEKAI